MNTTATGDFEFRLAGLAGAAYFEKFLSPGELEKSHGIGNTMLRSRFVVSRGLRRQLLAACTGREPGTLRFEEQPGAKPRLADAGGWDFNHSHAGDLVAVAVRRGPVGIDIETIREVRDMPSIVARYFHPDEAAAWRSLPERRRVGGFFILWSAREAAMKCTGLGLARGLPVTRVDPAVLDHAPCGARVGTADLALHRIEAPEKYIAFAAVAA